MPRLLFPPLRHALECVTVCRRQALRAAHASGRFSWQDAADRPRTQGAAAAATQQQQRQQQQQQLLSLLEQMQLQTHHASSSAAAGEGGCDVAAGCSDQQGLRGSAGTAAVKPGFYEQQMQRAVEDALAATAQQEISSSAAGSSHSAGVQHACGGAAGHAHHCCGHGDHSQANSDPLEPNNPLEPNEAEYAAAVKEALQELDATVVSINELLEEVREALLELH